MKTVNKITQLVCMLAFLIISNSSKAQCPTISNNLGCQVDGTIEIYDYVSPPSGPCNGALCSSSALSVPANGILYLNCSGCSPVCNVLVTITTIDGVTLPSSISVDFSVTSAVSLGLGGLPCTSTTNRNILYDPSSNSFKIFQ